METILFILTFFSYSDELKLQREYCENVYWNTTIGQEVKTELCAEFWYDKGWRY